MRGWSVAALISALLVLGVAATGWHMVHPGERIVVRRFGRVVEPAWSAGLHWGLPPGLDRIDRIRTDEVRRLSVGNPEGSADGLDPAAGEFLTGDLNLVRVAAVVQYRVASPADRITRVDDVESLLGRLAEASLSRSLARRSIDRVLRSDRQRISDEVASDLGRLNERHRLGLQILGVSLIDARPPAEVAPDFLAAQGAESHRDRRRTEAQTLGDTTVTAARAAAASRLEGARGDAQRKVILARSESQRFLALLGEAQRARPLTLERIYLDTMKSLLGRVRRKVVLPPGDVVDLTVLGLEE